MRKKMEEVQGYPIASIKMPEIVGPIKLPKKSEEDQRPVLKIIKFIEKGVNFLATKRLVKEIFKNDVTHRGFFIFVTGGGGDIPQCDVTLMCICYCIC